MQNIVAAEPDALSFNPGVPVTVEPEPWTTVTFPDP